MPLGDAQSRFQEIDEGFERAREEIRAGFNELYASILEFSLQSTLPPIEATDFFDFDEEDEVMDERKADHPPELTLAGKIIARIFMLGLGIFAAIIVVRMIVWAWSVNL